METELEHPVRVALLDLLGSIPTVTSNEAARRLGLNSGLTSFHLRQLARAGAIEEAPAADKRARPWRLARHADSHAHARAAGLGDLDRELEDAAYQQWIGRRDASGLPDEAFSAVIRVAPEQLPAVARAIREVLERHQGADASGPAVGAIIRLFPLLPAE